MTINRCFLRRIGDALWLFLICDCLNIVSIMVPPLGVWIAVRLGQIVRFDSPRRGKLG
jgi:hypothetical protein